jgi:hypothetical protein
MRDWYLNIKPVILEIFQKLIAVPEPEEYLQVNKYIELTSRTRGGTSQPTTWSFRRAHRYRSEHSQPTSLSTSLYFFSIGGKVDGNGKWMGGRLLQKIKNYNSNLPPSSTHLFLHLLLHLLHQHIGSRRRHRLSFGYHTSRIPPSTTPAYRFSSSSPSVGKGINVS